MSWVVRYLKGENMRRCVNAAAVVLLATGTGLTVGCVGGVAFALFTWGLSVGLGLAVGGAVGFVAGVLAAADGNNRFDGSGSLAGGLFGLLASGGCVAYAAAYGPGSGSLTADNVSFLVGWFVGGAGTGWLAGLLAERVGRAVVGSV